MIITIRIVFGQVHLTPANMMTSAMKVLQCQCTLKNPRSVWI